MKKRVTKMILLGIHQFQDPYYQGFAAQISFYIMLSLVPTLLVLSQILGILDISLDFMGRWIGQYVAPNMSKTLMPLINYKPVTSTNIVMVVMAIWSASRAQFCMMRIANYTYTDGKTTGGFFRERFRAMKTMSLTLFTMAFVVIIFVYGELILDAIFGKIFEGSLLKMLWTYLRWPLTGAMYFLMVSYNYYVLPYKKLKYRQLLPGSIFASIGMLVVTILYSSYTSYAVNYDILYGSLASVVAMMMWFYFISWVLCLGILFNKVWKDTNGGETL